MKSPRSNRRTCAGTPEDPILAAGVVIWRNPNQPEFLVMRNSLHGSWGFPKGHLDKDEGLRTCAVRELLEETKIHLTEAELFSDFADTSIYQPHGKSFKRVVMYLSKIPCTEEVEVSNEHDQVKWANAQQACELLSCYELQRTILLALSKISSS